MPTSRPLPVLCPERARHMPRSFAWIDHRLRSTGILQDMTADDIGLYLFLTLASDKQGLSCWRLDRVEREIPCLSMTALKAARQRLIDRQLLAYQPWYRGAIDGCYQLLSIPTPPPQPPRGGEPVSIGNLLSSFGGMGR